MNTDQPNKPIRSHEALVTTKMLSASEERLFNKIEASALSLKAEFKPEILEIKLDSD